MDDKERELRDVIAAEGRRGRRPIDLEVRRESRKSLENLLRIGTEEEFVRAMLDFGLREGSPELSKALEAWREFRG